MNFSSFTSVKDSNASMDSHNFILGIPGDEIFPDVNGNLEFYYNFDEIHTF